MIDSILQKVVEPISEKLIKTLSEKFKGYLKIKAIEKSDISPYINLLSCTKTLYGNDKPILISEFYHKPRIIMPNKKEVPHEEFIELIDQKNILLLGQMGQGKSIFLKQLSLDLISEGKLVLFYELRFLKENDDLINNLIDLLKDITKQDDISRELFFKLSETDNIYLVFDGFDEMSSKVSDIFIKNLKKLLLHPKFHIILSSRPEYYAEYASEQLYKLELDKYQFKDQAALIKKLITQKNKDSLGFNPEENEIEIQEIISQIENSETEIKNLLQTPLMVILYILRLQSKYTPARNLKEFFTDLFQVAFTRHDITKNNFRRERKSSLGDSELLDIFKLFCFDTKDQSKLTFDKNKCLFHLKSAINDLGLQDRVTPDKVFDEYTKVICFIINAHKNNQFMFLHRSIQDFYAALYISEQEAKHKEYFYANIIENRYAEFYSCVFFLQEIDKFSFIENIELPVIREFLERYKNSYSLPTHKKIENVFKNKFKVGNWYATNRIRNRFFPNDEEFSETDSKIVNNAILSLERYALDLENELKNKQKANRKRFSPDLEVVFDSHTL